MKLFKENVKYSETVSDYNTLQVEDFKEIFFETFEIKINGKEYLVEQVGTLGEFPIVLLEVSANGQSHSYPFVLKKGTFNVSFNVENVEIPDVDARLIEESASILPEVLKNKNELLDELERDRIYAENQLAIFHNQSKQEVDVFFKEKEEHLEEIVEGYERLLKENVEEVNSQIQESINRLEKNIAEKYISKLNKLEERIQSLSLLDEAERKANEYLLEKPTLMPEQHKLINERLNAYEKKTSKHFQDQIASMRRMIAVYSGGGSVATQFQNGGTMNGNLLITGSISANQYLGVASGNSSSLSAYLPLSGGRVTGPLTVDGNFTVDNDTLFINSSLDRVGIGTTSPQSKLDVRGDQMWGTTRKFWLLPDWSGYGELGAGTLIGSSGSGSGSFSFFPAINAGDPGAKVSMGYSSNGGISVYSAVEVENVASGYGTLKLMKAGGTVLIGLSSSQDTTTKLQVSGNSSFNGNVTVFGNLSSNNTAYIRVLSADRIEALSANITVIDIKQYELSGFNVKGTAYVEGDVKVSGELSAVSIVTPSMSGYRCYGYIAEFERALYSYGTLETYNINSFFNRAQFLSSVSVKGFLSGNSVSFNSLSVSNLTAWSLSAGRVAVASGTVTAPTFTFLESPTMGMYRVDGNSLGVTVNGTNQLTLDSSGNVYTTGRFQGGEGTASNPTFSYTTVPNTGIFFPTGDGISFSIRGNDVGRMTLSGFGIGTTTPNEKLTVIGNISATGTNSRLPNQQALSSSSILTKRLEMIEDRINRQDCVFGGGWTNAGSSGTGSVTLDFVGLRLDGATTGGPGEITVSGQGFNIGPPPSESEPGFLNFVYTNFTKPIVFGLRFHFAGNVYDPTAQSWGWFFGTADVAPNAQLSSFAPTNTVNNRGYVSLICRNGRLSAFTQNGSGAVSRSTELDLISGATIGNFGRQYYMIVENGTFSIYKNRTLIGSISGAPTSFVLGNGGGYSVNHTSISASTSLQRRLIITSLTAGWDA